MIKTDAAVEYIRAAGFTHLKLELEARLGRSGRFADTDYCEHFMLEQLTPEDRRAINFAHFYNDGSVDSEITFTFPVDRMDLGVKMIIAFNELARANGNGCDVSGAGMHFSILTSSRYPSSQQLPTRQLDNFVTEVTKLMPALYIGAMSGSFTRQLRFRMPKIGLGDGHYEKYSAIYVKNRASIEYRIFETCYQRPEAVYEYLGTIARTLEYYVDPTKKVAQANKVYEILEGEGISGYITLPDQVRILKNQIKHIVPDGMTVSEFLGARGIKLLVKAALEGQKAREARLVALYEEHKKAHEKIRKEPLSQYQLDNIEYWKSVEPGHPEWWYWERVTGHKYKIQPRAQYIKNNLKTVRALAQIRV